MTPHVTVALIVARMGLFLAPSIWAQSLNSELRRNGTVWKTSPFEQTFGHVIENIFS